MVHRRPSMPRHAPATSEAVRPYLIRRPVVCAPVVPDERAVDGVGNHGVRRGWPAAATPENVSHLLQAVSQLANIQADPLRAAVVPSRRRPRRDNVVTYRVRVDLKGTTPPLWRRLELASDVMLDEVHTIAQTAFGWLDSHSTSSPRGRSSTAVKRSITSAHSRSPRANREYPRRRCASTKCSSIRVTSSSICTTSVTAGSTS